MFVYFIRSGTDGPVKIGHAENVQARLATLQTGNPHPLHLLRVVRGGHQTECWLHSHFHHSWLRGEWFEYSPDMECIEVPAAPDRAARQKAKIPDTFLARLTHSLPKDDRNNFIRHLKQVWTAKRERGDARPLTEEECRIAASSAGIERPVLDRAYAA